MHTDSHTAIPKLIIQTHKSAHIHSELRQTWIDMHPGYQYIFFNDNDCNTFFNDEYPELLEAYKKLPLPVQKADLFRYAFIYKYGGVYSDADTICHAPVHDYIDLKLDQLVVGMEMTPTTYPHQINDYVQDYHCPFQILQWTFASPPKHPTLKDILNRISFALQRFSESDLNRYSKSARFTLELTGPMVFTSTLLGHMADHDNSNIRLLDQNTWGYNRFHQPPTHKQEQAQKEIKVEHLFEGSWREPPQGLWNRLRLIYSNYVRRQPI